MTDPTCGTCRFYDVPERSRSGLVAGFGRCHRFPPSGVAVRGDSDWCGEHDPAQPDVVDIPEWMLVASSDELGALVRCRHCATTWGYLDEGQIPKLLAGLVVAGTHGPMTLGEHGPGRCVADWQTTAPTEPAAEICDWQPDNVSHDFVEAQLVTCHKCGFQELAHTRGEANLLLVGHVRFNDGG